MVAILTAVHILIKSIHILQEFGKVHIAVMDLYISCGGTEEETCRVQCLCIKIRENGINELFHIAVGGSVCHEINREQDMELRPCCLAIFLSFIESAVVDGKAHSGEGSSHIIRSDPVRRFLGVIIITVDREAVAPDEIVAVAVVVFIFGAYIIVADGSL